MSEQMECCPDAPKPASTDPNDIVERLREIRHRMPADRFAWKGAIEEAITKIERLRADLVARDAQLAEMTRQRDAYRENLAWYRACCEIQGCTHPRVGSYKDKYCSNHDTAAKRGEVQSNG